MADRATATARPKGVGFPSIVVVILFATADSPALARANAEDNGRTFPINCVVTVWGICLNLHQRTRVDLDADSDPLTRAINWAKQRLRQIPQTVTTQLMGNVRPLSSALARAKAL